MPPYNRTYKILLILFIGATEGCQDFFSPLGGPGRSRDGSAGKKIKGV
jgi:hypothetical protein